MYPITDKDTKCYFKITIGQNLILGEPFFVDKYFFFNVEDKYILIGTNTTIINNWSFCEQLEPDWAIPYFELIVVFIIILFVCLFGYGDKMWRFLRRAHQRIKERALLREIASLKVEEEAAPGIAINANSRPIPETV